MSLDFKETPWAKWTELEVACQKEQRMVGKGMIWDGFNWGMYANRKTKGFQNQGSGQGLEVSEITGDNRLVKETVRAKESCVMTLVPRKEGIWMQNGDCIVKYCWVKSEKHFELILFGNMEVIFLCWQ